MLKKFSVRWQKLFTLFALAGALFSLWWFYFTYFENITLSSSEEDNESLIITNDQVSVFPVMYAGYLANPGMGWQTDPSPASSYLPETVLYANRGDISWKNLNPLEDVYDWTPLDEQFAFATTDGKQFSFRVFTMSGESYGGHQIPKWVLDKGAVILASGEPDYSNCVYQEQWGRFVNVLLKRYDGKPEIAFIDISGYGDFSEWGWRDQTEWDTLWETSYEQGTANSATLQEMDSQARRRLADMFIGGAYQSHPCRTMDGIIQFVDYYYDGAQKTQLVMPYAGIVQSTQYMFIKRRDVGFRFDCLGRDDSLPLAEISQIWRSAPVIYEFCGPDNFNINVARELLKDTHSIIIHNNDYSGDLNELQQLVTPIGYRFFLKEAVANAHVNAGEKLVLTMLWQNLGTSPVYLKMGQTPRLHLYLVDPVNNQVVLSFPVDVDLSTWFPADSFLSSSPPSYQVDAFIPIPASVPAGSYNLLAAIVDARTNLPVQLAVEGMNASGQISLFEIKVR